MKSSEKYMDLLEAACNAREDLYEAKIKGASRKRLDRLEAVYSNKTYKIIRHMEGLPPQECELVQRALKSLD